MSAERVRLVPPKEDLHPFAHVHVHKVCEVTHLNMYIHAQMSHASIHVLHIHMWYRIVGLHQRRRGGREVKCTSMARKELNSE